MSTHISNRFGPQAADVGDALAGNPRPGLRDAADGRSARDTAFSLIRGHPNVYLDISRVPLRRLLERCLRLDEIAVEVLFGYAWPGPGIRGIREEVDG